MKMALFPRAQPSVVVLRSINAEKGGGSNYIERC